MRDKISDAIRVFLEDRGIDPFYAATVFCILIALSYWRDFQKWKQLRYWQKGLAGSAAFAAIVFSLISLLRIVGIIYI